MSARTWILGVAIHHSSFDYPRWHPQRGIPPHTFYAETIVDLAAAADNPDDVVAWVLRGIARHLVSEAQLKRRAPRRITHRGTPIRRHASQWCDDIE
jgi:hypothetical protein